MVELLDQKFGLVNIRQAVNRFVNQYLKQRMSNNQCLHLEYLYLGESYGDTLVLKDELIHYYELVPADAADSQIAVPVKLLTGLPAASTLDIVAAPMEGVLQILSMEKTGLREEGEKLQRSLHGMHLVVCNRREKRRIAAMVRSKGTVCNFSDVDSVLWFRVDKRLEGNKVLMRWVGHFQVTKALPHSFFIRHLLSGAECDVLGSSMKL
ncbi:hypothetical protein PHMEG_00011796 [Phytophthora megakarya]|uniref:Uncharacterized protein n=1 Tax=Phytophthora megakarya TaxID=4795 RepID=A0A225WBS8_9STRA|nr:hypothetical protein PHMEG_00011796 [Phytophthora megakarya]